MMAPPTCTRASEKSFSAAVSAGRRSPIDDVAEEGNKRAVHRGAGLLQGPGQLAFLGKERGFVRLYSHLRELACGHVRPFVADALLGSFRSSDELPIQISWVAK
jgi:hypothetical protein